mgnify:CR=1 FL=1
MGNKYYIPVPKLEHIETELDSEIITKILWHLKNRKYKRIDPSRFGFGAVYADGHKSETVYKLGLPDGSKYLIRKTLVVKLGKNFNLTYFIKKYETIEKSEKPTPAKLLAYGRAPNLTSPPMLPLDIIQNV